MPLLERDHLLAELSAIASGTAAGRGAFVAIVGEAGVGKTSLLDEATRRAASIMRVLSSGCEALFTPRPLGPFYDIESELGIDIALSREKLFPSVLAALTRVPTILIVEDVHWADRATLDLLKYLARRASRSPLMLAVSYRDDPMAADHPLIALLGETAVRRLQVDPLSLSAVEQLGGSRDVYAITAGNPFYVTEVLASGSDAVPPTVRDAVIARIASLSAGSRAVLEFASLMPGRAELSLIDADPGDIEEAARSGIVRIENGALIFRHELARRAVEDALSDIRRLPAHRAILQRLGANAPRARLAHHALGARDAEAILRHSMAAAEEAAAASAHREAANHYRNALAWSGALSERERAELLEALAYQCYLTEQLEEALQRRIQALAIWRALGDERREGDTLRWQSRLLWFLGRNQEARAAAEAAIETLEPIGTSSELAMAYSNQAQLHMLSQEIEATLDNGNRAIAMATELGDNAVLSHALNNVGVAEFLSGDHASDKLQRSLAIALENGLEEHAARAYTNLGTELVREAMYERGRAYLDEGIAWCRDRDLDSWVLYMSAWHARLDFETGNWDAAEATAMEVLAHRSASPISRIPALAVLGRLRARRGRQDAGELLDEAHKLAEKTGEFQRLAPVAAARAEAAWLRGDAELAAREAEPAFAMSANFREPWARGDLALWMWRGGAITTAPDGIAEPYALQIDRRWREAASAFESAGRPFEAAIALTDGDAEAVQRAIAIFERLVAHVNVVRPRRFSSGLTRREMEILELLDKGLRNADIASRLAVSAKTVDHHVSSILAKLGARTRGEAAKIYRTQTQK
jgi:DNA-binding CsgD family transcriptional regulator